MDWHSEVKKIKRRQQKWQEGAIFKVGRSRQHWNEGNVSRMK
jgi:hypothetical protein